MKVLVTGANGFVGSMLCRKMVEMKYSVRGLIRKTSDLSLLKNLHIHESIGSLNEPESLVCATRDIECVYHTASVVSDWGSWEYFYKTNVKGTDNLLKACRKNQVRRFIYISSVAVHSFIDAQDMNENSPQLPTPYIYCQTKRAAEDLVMTYHRRGDIAASIVRPGDIFGPGDRVTLKRMLKILRLGFMAHINGGHKLGPFTYVENLVDGLILAGIKERAIGETYIITDGLKLTWREYFNKLTRALEVPKVRLSINGFFAYRLAALFEWLYGTLNIQKRPFITRYLVEHLRGDFHFTIAKAQKELGYEPLIKIDEAISRTAEWAKENLLK